MTPKIVVLALVSLLSPLAGLFAQTTLVSWSNTNSGRLKGSDNLTFLTSGSSAVDGDGAVLQLGYYSAATTTDNFAGTFIPLTGESSANTAFSTGTSKTSIGDTGGFADGRFNLSSSFNVNDSTRNKNLPAANTPLTILYYNNTTIATSTAFGAVSNDSWLWQTPTNAGSVVTISLTGTTPGLEFQGGGAGFFTNMPVPEPSTWVVVIGVFSGMVIFRKRFSKA